MSPSSSYIKEEWEDCTYWANESGHFNLSNLADGTCLVVMGQSDWTTYFSGYLSSLLQPQTQQRAFLGLSDIEKPKRKQIRCIWLTKFELNKNRF